MSYEKTFFLFFLCRFSATRDGHLQQSIFFTTQNIEKHKNIFGGMREGRQKASGLWLTPSSSTTMFFFSGDFWVSGVFRTVGFGAVNCFGGVSTMD
jgi:hypothetical protein